MLFRSAIASAAYNSVDKKIIPELKVLYPAAEAIAMAKTVELQVDSTQTDTLTIVLMKFSNNPIEKSLKLVLNSAYGACMDINNELYDPRQGMSICVNGQLLLLDLIEKVELEFKGFFYRIIIFFKLYPCISYLTVFRWIFYISTQ